jgi:uncharacterized protein
VNLVLPKSPFHEGELLIQQRAGETAAARRNGQIITDMLGTGMAQFIKQQSMVILSSVDQQQNIWASVLFGLPGFVDAVNPQMIELDLTKVRNNEDDPLWVNIRKGDQIGMLLIELVSRRRLRVNGSINRVNHDKLRLDILECYPNCPKYIQRRQVSPTVSMSKRECFETRSGQFLVTDQQVWIASSDTVFVVSTHSSRGADASHRGGNPGFVQILNEQVLRIPDYSGNSMFNTLGNLAVDSRAGLLFIDFDRGRTLQLTGRVVIHWHMNSPEDSTGGTHRCWDFMIEKWVEIDLPQSPSWEFLDFSPHNPTVVSL